MNVGSGVMDLVRIELHSLVSQRRYSDAKVLAKEFDLTREFGDLLDSHFKKEVEEGDASEG